jgi:hypothetical protein
MGLESFWLIGRTLQFSTDDFSVVVTYNLYRGFRKAQSREDVRKLPK